MLDEKYSTKKILLIIFIVSLVIRLGFGIVMFNMNGVSKFCDDWDYINYANSIIDQGVFVPDLNKLHPGSHVVGPSFPLIIALMFLIFGQNYIPIVILNAIISSLIPILIYFLSKSVFNKKIALFSSIWSIFYVLHIRYIQMVRKEVWLAFLFPLVIFLFILETKRNNITWKSLILPVIYTFFIHMDERFFTYFPIFLIAFLLLDKVSLKAGFRKSIVLGSLTIILMVPWLVRNYQVYDRPLILTERTAKFTDKLFGYEDINKKRKIEKQRMIELYIAKRDSILAGKKINLKYNRVRKMKKGIELGYIPHKFNRWERYWAEFKEFWRPIRISGGYVGRGFRFEGPSWSLKHNLSEGLTYGILLPFFLIGCYFVFKYKNRYGIFFVFIIFIHTIIHVVLAHVRNRYRIPIDSFIIMLAFYGLVNFKNVIDKVKNKN